MLPFARYAPSVIRVVFDSTVFLRGAMNPASRWGRLLFDEWDRYRLIVSIPIMREVLDVITRPELVLKLRGPAEEDIRRVLALLSSTLVVLPDPIPPICRDPKDDVFIATAVAAKASYLVSEDRDLLDLGAYRSTRIVDAATFSSIIRR
jgi:putative PIN family toxin of toxin-antitoxin system